MNASESLTFRQSVCLVILGAAVGFFPSVGTVYIQAKNQREQMLMDRRIAAIKDFAASYYRLATDVLPRVKACRSAFDASKTAVLQGNTDEALKLLPVTGGAIDALTQQENAWTADINTQIAVTNSLFHEKYQFLHFVVPTPSVIPNAHEQHNKATTMASMDSGLRTIEASTIDRLEQGKQILASLMQDLEKQ